MELTLLIRRMSIENVIRGFPMVLSELVLSEPEVGPEPRRTR